MQTLQQGQIQQMLPQNQTSQSYEQGQMVKPMQTQPLDFSQSSSPMDTVLLPIQNQEQTSSTASTSHTLALTPPSPRASFQSEDDEGTAVTENNWQEVRSTKRRKVTSSQVRPEIISLHN